MVVQRNVDIVLTSPEKLAAVVEQLKVDTVYLTGFWRLAQQCISVLLRVNLGFLERPGVQIILLLKAATGTKHTHKNMSKKMRNAKWMRWRIYGPHNNLQHMK